LDFKFERKLRKSGHRTIFGVDEVGVGPLAGPVVACAVTMPVFFTFYDISGAMDIIKRLKDSKGLSHKQREEFLLEFRTGGEFVWEVASVSPKIIDRINIYEARLLAARRAVQKLEKSVSRKADMLILDGRSRLAIKREQQAIVKGDERIALCAIASIIAKVKRDRMMMRYHKKYPWYRYDLHKGYGTKLHFAMLKKYGPSAIHRNSFKLLTK